FFFFFSSRRRHTRFSRDWSSDVCSSDLYSSRPDRVRIFEALTTLANSILKEPGKKGLVIPFEYESGKFIIFSDQHRGSRNGADDFVLAEPNYLAALEHYNNSDFTLINLGDSE